MKFFYLIYLLYCLINSINAITNAKYAVACERDKLSIKCENNKIINILDGNYGRSSESTCMNKNMKNVTCYAEETISVLTDLCEGRSECTVEAENKVFGDPCPHTYKYLFVLYHCVSLQEFKLGLACEHKPLKLACDPGKVIQIYEANYGRRSRITCSDGPQKSTNCISEHSDNVIGGFCNHKRICTVMASNHIFGDPCVGTFKYLSVKYKCIAGPAECESKSVISPELKCLDGSIILPSLLCDGQKDCPDGDDELMCDYNNKFTCENTKLEIKCDKDESIKIVNANYGRISQKICPQSNIKEDINCKARNSKKILRDTCEGKRKCEIQASNNIFGDPCQHIFKYLEVQYECLPGTGSHKIIPRSLA